MPNPTPGHPTALRFCLSCCLTLSCWVVWIVLGVTLGCLAYVAAIREFPVPGFVLRRIEAQLADDRLALRFGRVRFDPTGRILLENVSLHSLQFEEPLLSARHVYVENTLWSWFVGQNVPREIRIEGATLQLPAMLSPTGAAESIVRDLAATLRREHGVWQIDQLAGHVGAAPVTVHGTLSPPRTPGAPPLHLADLVGRFLKTGRQFAVHVARLDAFDSPSLEVRLETDATGHTLAELLFTAEGVHQRAGALPWPLALGPLAASASVQLDAPAGQSVPISLAVRSGDWAGEHAAEDLRAVVTVGWPAAGLVLEPREALLTAARLRSFGETIGAPVVRLHLGQWPAIRAEAAGAVGHEALALGVEADLREKSARVRFAGRGRPAFVNDLLARRTPRFAPFLVLADPLAAQAELRFAPGGVFAGLAARVHGGRIDSRGVAISGVEGTLIFDGRELLARDAVLRAGENSARGSYWMDVGTRDYRMLLSGRLRPMDIGGWIRGPWWAGLWGNFEFPVAPPTADVDVAGRWTDGRLSRNFIRADAPGARVRGTDFDWVRTTIFTRPHFTHALRLAGSRQGGAQRIDGSFIRRARLDSPGDADIELDLASNLDSEAMNQLTLGAAAPILKDWSFNIPPRLEYAGQWTKLAAGGRFDVTFAGRAEGGLRYYGFPLDSVEARGGLSGTELRLDRITFTAAGGNGTGKASLGGPPDNRRLGFDLYVKDAELGRSVHAVQQYDAARTGAPPPSGPDSEFLRRAGSGRLEIAVSAHGAPGDIPSFVGSGNAQLTEANLGEIHLFGLLSQVLSGLSLNFSTLKLDTARSSFELAQGRLHFPDVKVTGASGAVIDAKGDYEFAGGTVNFTARFTPYENRRNILTAGLSLVLNPLSNIIELKLGGRLADPKWSYSIGSSAPAGAAPGPATETPPVAPPATPPAEPPPPAGKP